MRDDCSYFYNKYQDRLEEGVSKEIARIILPQNIYSEAYWTVSLQGVMHFLDQRLKPDSQKEIQMFANAVKECISKDLEELGIEYRT